MSLDNIQLNGWPTFTELRCLDCAVRVKQWPEDRGPDATLPAPCAECSGTRGVYMRVAYNPHANPMAKAVAEGRLSLGGTVSPAGPSGSRVEIAASVGKAGSERRVVSIAPRWLRHFMAWLLGYYWGPCPLCRREFAGFEASPVTLLKDFTPSGDGCGAGVGELVCRRCEKQADRLNGERFGVRHVGGGEFSFRVEIPFEFLPMTPGAVVLRSATPDSDDDASRGEDS